MVPMDILWRKLSPRVSKEKHNITQIGLRAGCVLMMGVVAIIVPQLGPFIALVGAVFLSFLGKLGKHIHFCCCRKLKFH